jgi:hypothetical protein
MNGWGRALLLVTVGVALGTGCGGRTGMLYDDSYDPDPEGGTTFTAGSGGRPGAGGKPGKGGRPGVGGGVGATAGFGGSIPVGGFGTAGTPAGGFGFGGFGGGFPTGGFGFGGAFPTGGFPGVAGSGPFGCESCLLQNCSNEFLQCISDLGCISILGCVQATGCDSFDCNSPDTCGPVIEQWGGPFSPSMDILFETVSCTLTSGCPCN